MQSDTVNTFRVTFNCFGANAALQIVNICCVNSLLVAAPPPRRKRFHLGSDRMGITISMPQQILIVVWKQ